MPEWSRDREGAVDMAQSAALWHSRLCAGGECVSKCSRFSMRIFQATVNDRKRSMPDTTAPSRTRLRSELFCGQHRLGLAPLAAGCLLLAGLGAFRFLFDADEAHSWFLGHTFGAACWFRARFGIPCPNCGMTRSLILAAHGEFARSLRLAPGGLATVLASAATSLMLGALGAAMLWGQTSAVRKLQAALRATVLACAGVSASVWLGGWMVQVVQGLRSR